MEGLYTIKWFILSLTRKGKSITVKTKQGIFALPIGVKDPISRFLYTRRRFQFRLMSDAMALIRDLYALPRGKGIVMDIGANNGLMSIGLLYNQLLEKAIAIEPEPTNFSRLKHNVRLNHLEKEIVCLNYAVSDGKSTLPLELSETNYGDHRIKKPNDQKEMFDELTRSVIHVEAMTLEELLTDLVPEMYEGISVIWIDVQGYEGYVFRGAKKFLSSKDIPVVSEIWPYAIARTGMSKEEFCGMVEKIWSHYWVKRGKKFVRYPIVEFCSFFEELDSGPNGADDVIFTNGK